MARYQLRYLSAAAMETIDVEDADEAERVARLRLLFREPGFAIAVLSDGHELLRLIQGARTPRPFA
jgi:hypothetical protein